MDERKAGGLRKSPHHILTDKEVEILKSDIAAIDADVSKFAFNQGLRTCYSDDRDLVLVRGDVFPDEVYSVHPRDMMSARAVLAHEYYGHRPNRGTLLPESSWNDEFRASYSAALNTPGLTQQDRTFLILDALERAKAAGVTIRWNSFMRRMVYGSDYEQEQTEANSR